MKNCLTTLESGGRLGAVHGKWVAKAVLQKGISFLPHPQRANHFFQDHVTHSTTLTREFVAMHVGWAADHLDALRRHGETTEGFRAVELGSGWFPIVPLCFHLAGASSVEMVDLEDLSRPELVRQAVEAVVDGVDSGMCDRLGDIDAVRVDELRAVLGRLDRLGHTDALASIGLRVHPADARDLELDVPPDLITSNTVFEHIEPDVLEAILVRFATIARPGTVMSHLVDHCDHYAYVDEDVSVYHFLRYSDAAWKVIDNHLQPMNRLRASEYRAMYERAGVSITEEHLFGDDPLDLIGEHIHQRFLDMDPADVAAKASLLVTVF